MKGNKTWFVIIAITVAAVSRLLPHPWNFTPMTGITLLGACYLGNRFFSFLVPFLAWMVSDLLVNWLVQAHFLPTGNYFFSYTALGVYTSLFLIWMVGNVLRRNIRFSNVVLASLVSSLIFYVVSNSIDFINNPFYSQNFNGWVKCMTMALPFYSNDYGIIFGSFFLNGVMGDLFFCGALFGTYYWVNSRSLKPATA